MKTKRTLYSQVRLLNIRIQQLGKQYLTRIILPVAAIIKNSILWFSTYTYIIYKRIKNKK